ncbi:MAG TPA: MFS transporter [Methylophilus sp.]|nr:MFS transporter [Methylophilus sp.]HQQ33764.1 MFS transporter [Methylophilus sp.]
MSTPQSISQILAFNRFAFAKLLTYRIQLVLAYQIMAVAVGWHIYEITRDPLSLGLIGLAEVIPYFASALFAGYAVDHYSRRWFGVLSALMLSMNGLTLTAIAAGYLQANSVFWIYASIAFTGLARAFIAPSYSALMAIILPRDSYVRAAGLGTSVFQVGLIAGPALGGLLVGFAGKTVAYAITAGLCLNAAATLITLHVEEPPSAETAPVFTSIAQGLRFVWNSQILFSAQMLDMFAVLLGGAVAMLPAFIHDVYRLGPETLGVLRAAPAVGAMMMAFYLARHPINLHAGRYLLWSVAGFGVCIICFGITQQYWLAGLFLLLSGAFDGVSVVLRSTIMQLATPDDMRGRVSAINGIFIGSSNELGAFESGVAARLLGLVPSVVFGAVMTLVVVGVTAKFSPKLRNLELHQLH